MFLTHVGILSSVILLTSSYHAPINLVIILSIKFFILSYPPKSFFHFYVMIISHILFNSKRFSTKFLKYIYICTTPHDS